MSKPIEERLFGNVERIPFSGCWIWMGYTNKKGYGSIAINHSTTKVAHRVAWEIASGQPIPDGLLVCHACDVPQCINPAHLWLGTNQQNIADSAKKGRLSVNHAMLKRTHCNHGHEFTPENTVRYWGYRACKACINARKRSDYRKKVLAALPESVNQEQEIHA